MPQKIAGLLVSLWPHISRRRRLQLGVLIILMILASFVEIVSIGAVLPFLAVFVDPNLVFNHPVAVPIIRALGFTSADQLLLPLTIAFGAAALLAGTMRLLLLFVSTRVAFATGGELGISIYRRTLYQPYAVHVARNSSEIISGIFNKANSVSTNVLMPIFNLLGSSVMLLAILGALLVVDPISALVAFAGFGLIYGIIIRVTRRHLSANSKRIAREATQVLKSLQEGLGGIRDVLIDGSQAAYCKIYRNADLPLRRAKGNNDFIINSPRYAMEALGMLLIGGLAYGLSRQPDGIAKAIPILGALALGAQRLLPVVQQGYAAFSNIRGSQASLEDTIGLLNQPLPAHADQPAQQSIPYRQKICLDKISFRYTPETPSVLHDLSLTILKGTRVGFIGATGSGKSTLLDIVMGLLQPSAGSLTIDDKTIDAGNRRGWQAHIAHVPQSIYLADSTIEENIAFGLPVDQIDRERVRRSARQAQVGDLIESWPQQYQTFVGERGIRLSGGQRQRIGIARALYKQADVIILDEATSALDNETERAVMEAIEKLGQDITILIVAHRLTTLQTCSQIIQLGNGGVLRVGKYQDLVGKSG
jgi:ATP-binding cassette subfamily B protein